MSPAPARGVAVARVLALAALLATALARPCAAGGTAAAAPGGPVTDPAPDSLAGRVVRDVAVDAREIFDPLPAGPLRGLYDFANRLHVRTRRSTVRSALVIAPGDRWSPGRAQESERRLRALDFLIPDSVRAIAVGDAPDTVDVRVVTHDTWTTSPEFNFESGGGQRFGTFAFTERNLAGLGLTVSAIYREEPVGISRFLSMDDATLAGTHWGASFVAGSGDVGKSNAVSVGLPFWADDAPLTMGSAWKRDVTLAHLYEGDAEVARIPVRVENTEVSWGTGRRAPDGTVQRFVATFRAFDRRFGVSQLEPGSPPDFGGGEEELRLRRLEGEMTLWRPRFVVKRGVDFMDRAEDFDLGTQFRIGLGVAPRAFGSDADEGWLHGRVETGAGGGPGGFILAGAELRSRVRSGLRETLGRVHVRWVAQPAGAATLVTAVSGTAGRRMPRDFQLRVGALSGLRGFGVNDLAGTQIWRGNAEVRWTAWRNVLQLVTIGGAVFWDSGRAYGPGSGGESWHHDAGLGLRLSLPHSALNAVARFDVAWPVAPRVDAHHGPAYSFGSGQAF